MSHKFKSGDTVIYIYSNYKYILSLKAPKVRYNNGPISWKCTILKDLSKRMFYKNLPKLDCEFHELYMRPMSKLERAMK